MKRFLSSLILGVGVCIPVVTHANGPATLYWTMPAYNTNGSPLTNLAGYKIYYSMNPKNLWHVKDITNITTTTRKLYNLKTGTWYFGIRAYNTSGAASDLSNIVSKTIP